MIVQFAAGGRVEKFVIGNAAPQEEREARREFQIADAVGRVGSSVRGIALEAIDELRIGENAAQRHLDAGFEIALITAGLIEAEEGFEIRVGDGPAIGVARERGDDFFGAGKLVTFASGMADENLTAAGSVAGTLRIEWTADGHAEHVRQTFGIAGIESAAVNGLHQILRRAVAALQERDGDRLRARVDMDPRLHVVLRLRHAELGGSGGIESRWLLASWLLAGWRLATGRRRRRRFDLFRINGQGLDACAVQRDFEQLILGVVAE